MLTTFLAVDAIDWPEEASIDRLKHQKVIRKIPSSVIEHAHGLAIFTVWRAGFMVSGPSSLFFPCAVS